MRRKIQVVRLVVRGGRCEIKHRTAAVKSTKGIRFLDFLVFPANPFSAQGLQYRPSVEVMASHGR